MKLEIEITEQEIQEIFERKVRSALADQRDSWSADSHIKERVKYHWDAAVEARVVGMIGDSNVLKEMVDRTVEARVKARVQAALKAV